MRKLKFKTPYRHFFKPGDIGEQHDQKAKELVDLGYADYVDVETEAPANKEVKTAKRTGSQCPDCERWFASEGGMKRHRGRMHKQQINCLKRNYGLRIDNQSTCQRAS